MRADRHRLTEEGSGNGGHLAELERSEAELLSSQDTHEEIADRLGISASVVRSYCNHLRQRSRLERCTHVQHADVRTEQPPPWDWFTRPQDPRQDQEQPPDPPAPQSYRQPAHAQVARISHFT